MKISFDKYEGILELIDLIDGTEESVNTFIDKFKRYTGIKDIMLAGDNVFEIENLDFLELEDLSAYFVIQELIETKYYKELLKLAELVDSREEFCKKATRLTGIEVRQYGTVVRLNNIDFATKTELVEYLKAYEIFDSLAEMCYDYDIAEDGRGIALDGIAFVHDCRQSMLDNPQDNYPIEGYLREGNVDWKKVESTAFALHKTKQGDVEILKLLYDAGVKSIYPKRTNDFGLIEKPYPIAVFKKKHFFIFKSKDM